MLTPIFELKKTQTRMKKVYQKTRAFFTEKNFMLKLWKKRTFFLGLRKKQRKVMTILISSLKFIAT
jgi:hypothetical protein